jgi:hypothetical protein
LLYTAKIIAKILRRRIERKIEDVLAEDQFGFRSYWMTLREGEDTVI